MFNIFPEFESGQVLTKDELNWLSCYLDTQNRQTRRLLVGCGIVSGLQIKLNGNAIQISNGVAVTSAGHLLTLSSQQNTFVNYNKVRKLEAKPGEQFAFHYIADGDNEALDYTNSIAANTIYFKNFTADILELVPENENGGTPISSAAATGKVVMLYLEIVQKDLKECEGDNCQEKGKKYILQPLPLLISQQDAITLLQQEYKMQGAAAADLERRAFPWLYMPIVQILRPVFGAGSYDVYNELVPATDYLRCIVDFKNHLTQVSTAMENSLNDLRIYCGYPPSNTRTSQLIIEKINNANLSTASGLRKCQLYYDFLWTYVQAYQEILVEAQSLRAKKFLSETDFPQHVLLGKVETVNADYDWPLSIEPSMYRHEFHSRSVQTQQAILVKKLGVMLQRLEKIITTANLNFVDATLNIRINAGGNSGAKLSAQAIPHYFSDEIFRTWNLESRHKTLATKVPFYNSLDDSLVSSAANALNKQPYAIQNDSNFFRIEGVHGKAATTALGTVQSLRKKYAMPFEVLLLAVSKTSPAINSNNGPINEDLESMYNITKAELNKQIQFSMNYFGNLEMDADQYSQVKKGLTSAMTQTYMELAPFYSGYYTVGAMAMDVKKMVAADNIYTSAMPIKLDINDPMVTLKKVTNEKVATEAAAVSAPKETVKAASGEAGNMFMYATVAYYPIGNYIFFFQNTIGSLVSDIKDDAEFAGASDISFYTRLLSASKKAAQNDSVNTIFYDLLELHVSLNLLNSYLPKNFSDLNVSKYSEVLNKELLDIAQKTEILIDAKTADEIKNYALLTNIEKAPVLDCVRRIRYDDDWVKIEQLATELINRNGGIGVEGQLERFLKLHPGLAHGSGVCKGGTYILVYNEQSTIIADFYLPYALATNVRPLQFALIENKTLTLSGTVKSSNGEAVSAILTIGSASIATDAAGQFNMLVSANTSLKLSCQADGYETLSRTIDIKDASQSLELIMTPAKPKVFINTVRFLLKTGAPLNRNVSLLNVQNNQTVVATAGIMPVSGTSGNKFSFRISDLSLLQQDFDVVISDKDSNTNIVVSDAKPVIINIKMQDGSAFQPTMLNEITAFSANKQLTLSSSTIGVYQSTERIDVAETVSIKVVYNSQTISVNSTAQNAVDIIVPNVVRYLNYGIAVTGIMQRLVAVFNPKITINDQSLAIDGQTGTAVTKLISTKTISFGPEFINAPKVEIPIRDNIANVVMIIDNNIIARRIDITASNAMKFFSATLKQEQINVISDMIPGVRILSQNLKMDATNFYVLIMMPDMIKQVTTAMRL